MNENLSKMVAESDPESDVIFSETDLNLTTDEVPSEVEEPTVEEVVNNKIGLVSLSEWFDKNASNFDNISAVKASIRGVAPNKTLIVAVNDGTGEKDSEGNQKRELQLFKNSDVHPVLDLEGIDMQVYNNGFKIVHQFSGDIFIKCYGVKTGLIAVYCSNIGGKLIPYHIQKVKKKDTEIEVVPPRSPEATQAKLSGEANVEALQLLYKQSAKVADELRTNQDVVNWLITRQSEVTDINHHFQIDSVIIDTLR